jgi:hypothetical protein
VAIKVDAVFAEMLIDNVWLTPVFDLTHIEGLYKMPVAVVPASFDSREKSLDVFDEPLSSCILVADDSETGPGA